MEEGIALVFLIGEQRAQGGGAPDVLAFGAGDVALGKLVRNGVEAVPVQEPPCDLSDDLSFFFIDFHSALLPLAESVQVWADGDGAVFIGLPQPPADVAADGLRLGL